jgi:hypothetical protein
MGGFSSRVLGFHPDLHPSPELMSLSRIPHNVSDCLRPVSELNQCVQDLLRDAVCIP